MAVNVYIRKRIKGSNQQLKLLPLERRKSREKLTRRKQMEGKNMYNSKKKINSVKIKKQCRGKKNLTLFTDVIFAYLENSKVSTKQTNTI